MNLVKLDEYDYIVLPGVIRVTLGGGNDPIMIDILSEIDKLGGGTIYVEGDYYSYLDYDLFSENGIYYLDLEVVQMIP